MEGNSAARSPLRAFPALKTSTLDVEVVCHVGTFHSFTARFCSAAPQLRFGDRADGAGDGNLHPWLISSWEQALRCLLRGGGKGSELKTAKIGIS